MKNVLIVIGAFAVICCIAFMCGGKSYRDGDLQTPIENKDSIEEASKPEPYDSLIVRTRDEIKFRTLIEHKGRQEFGSCVMTAMYSIEELDLFGKKYDEPKIGVYQLVLNLSHKGAYKPETIVLICDGEPRQISPNFTKAVAMGKFFLLFNITPYGGNSDVPIKIMKSKSVEIRVRYDNGDDIIKVPDEDKEAIRTIYRSYIHDGGKDFYFK